MATYNTDWLYHSNTCSFRIQAVENSYNASSNKTTVTFNFQIKYTSSVVTSGWLVSGTFKMGINGTTYTHTQDDVYYNPTIEDTFTIFSKKVEIEHNSDGTKTVPVTMYANMVAAGIFGTVSRNITLTTQNRKNTISSITGGTIGGTMTVNINKPSSLSTTTVYLQVNGCTWFTPVSNSSDTSITFTVPNDLANHMPNEVTAVGRIIIRTFYNGVALADSDYARDKEFIVPDNMRYSITDVTRNTDTEINGQLKWVQGKSKLRINIFTDNTNAYGATITEYKFTFDGKTYYGNNTWTGVINSSGFKAIQVTITDSRGRTATYNTGISIYDYKNPWGLISAYRCDELGNRDDVNGQCAKITYSGSNSSVDGANTFELLIQASESGSTDWYDVVWSTTPAENATAITDPTDYLLDLGKIYTFKLTVSDWYTSTSYIATVYTSEAVMNFKAGGTGIAIGGICTQDDSVQINREIQMYNKSIVYEGVSDEDQRVAWVPGTNSNMLSLTRLTTSSSGSGQTFMEIDKSNDCYNQCKNNYFANNIFLRNNSWSSLTYAEIRYQNSQSYYYAQSPDANENIGYWHDVDGAIWYYNALSGQLFLKAGYGNASDRRLKHDFNEFNNWDDYYNFYMSLKPQTFKYNEDMRNETYIGLLAQDVEDSINNNNLTNEKLSLVKSTDANYDTDEEIYTLAYQELIPLNIKMIQKHEHDIQDLKDKVAKFRETANKLKNNSEI